MAETDPVEIRCTPDDRRATVAELGEDLGKAQRHNGFTVDDMAVPVTDGDQRGDRNSRAPVQEGGQDAGRVRVVVAEDDVLLREVWPACWIGRVLMSWGRPVMVCSCWGWCVSRPRSWW